MASAPNEPAVPVLTKELYAAHQRVLKNVAADDDKQTPAKNIKNVGIKERMDGRAV